VERGRVIDVGLLSKIQGKISKRHVLEAEGSSKGVREKNMDERYEG